ncbi:uncharacterized protein BO80DRAFT_479529 [Aspergillus ibericus CBS 121593]|uniref:Protein kinase domain-containing protein n=1 Tax=Aspergillus ibericus CBS 121593 TaxID=1448316 RepID=A0A395GX49_9EURO|nr:hypothetical protein BO80DRAFT_479529 [Aspergillus ibericus CBS 121593]RAK98633.1 hypothetical protein BO80DRAFT_479529 [Aspergillus ibericus CBS 121593]
MPETHLSSVINYGLVESYTNGHYVEVFSRMYDPSGEPLRKLIELLGSLCQPYFRAYARYRGDDLDSELRDNTQILLQLNQKQLSKISPDQQPCEEYPIRHTIETDLPSYQLSAVTRIRTFHERRTYEVSINGTNYFCRIATGRHDHMFQNEFNALRKIKKCGLSLRVPELTGFVGVEEQLPGILETFFPHQSRLSDIDMAVAELDERRKWTAQIGDAVRRLHQHGIAWGRADASNILIDDHRNAWLVDFQDSLLTREPSDIEDIEAMDAAIDKDLKDLDKIKEFLCLSA